MLHPSLTWLLPLLALATAYPNGAPTSKCGDMIPAHGVDAQTSAAPYTIGVSSSTYTGGQTLTVTVNATSADPSLAYFKGILVEARRASCLLNQNEAVGGFALGAGESELKLLTCNSIAQSAVTHSSKANKTSKTFTWTAPATSVGHLQFRFTIVRDTRVFWTNVMSSTVMDPTAPNLPTPADCGVTAVVTSEGTMAASSTPAKSPTTTDSSGTRLKFSFLCVFASFLKFL